MSRRQGTDAAWEQLHQMIWDRITSATNRALVYRVPLADGDLVDAVMDLFEMVGFDDGDRLHMWTKPARPAPDVREDIGT